MPLLWRERHSHTTANSAYDNDVTHNAYITTKSMFSMFSSKFCMKYEFGNTDTEVFCNTEYRTDFKKYQKNTEYRYPLKIPIATQL